VSLEVEELPNIAELMPVMADFDDFDEAKQGTRHSGSAPDQQNNQETRTYKGATYVKGADGQWYLQKK
jgi:hypothetical protein